MGGRGSSSGMSASGKPYGSEYTTLLSVGNVKFVKPNAGAATAPLETRTRGRVYVTIGSDGAPRFISYYGVDSKRRKQIDLARPHKGVLPHTHHGYEHNEGDGAKGFSYLTPEEKAMVDRVMDLWHNRHSK